MSLFHINVTLHVLAALTWLGGMFFLAAVGAPVLRTVEPPTLRSQLFQKLGARFRTVGWISIGVLLVTGVGNLYFRGVLIGDHWTDSVFWTGPYGSALAWKLGAVALMLANQAVHDFWFGPRAGKLAPGSDERIRARKWASWLARVNVLAGVVLVWAAVRLARGG